MRGTPSGAKKGAPKRFSRPKPRLSGAKHPQHGVSSGSRCPRVRCRNDTPNTLQTVSLRGWVNRLGRVTTRSWVWVERVRA